METAEAAAPTSDERTIAMLAHVLQIFASFWGPLIVYLVKRESRFVAFHALQAVFLQVVFMVLWLAGGVLWMGFIFGMIFAQSDKPHSSQAPPFIPIILFIVVFGLAACGWILNIVLGIIYGIKASKGEWAEYPIIGRWARRLAS